jgi:hypothetical protein
LFIIPLFGLFLNVLLRKDYKYTLKIVLAYLLFGVIIYFHIKNVIPHLDSFSLFPKSSISRKLAGGIEFIFETIIFGRDLYFLKPILIFHSIFGFIGLISLRNRYSDIFLSISFITVALYFIVGGKYGGYWGIVYLPFLIPFSILGLKRGLGLIHMQDNKYRPSKELK